MPSSRYSDIFLPGWKTNCYQAYQNILPAPIVSLSENGAQNIYIAPDAVEFLSLLGSEFTSYFESIKFDWKRLAGAKVLEIQGKNAYDYVDYVASTQSGNFLDHGIRVNSVYRYELYNRVVCGLTQNT